MKTVPKTMLVVGGGYIGLELGTVYAALGTEVSVVEMLDRLLPGADRDLVNVLAKRVRTICKQVLTSTKVVEDGGEGRRRPRHLRGRGRAEDAGLRSGARVDRPPAQRQRPGHRDGPASR